MADENMVHRAVQPDENYQNHDENEWKNEENEENINDTGKCYFL